MTFSNYCAVVVEATDAKEVSMGELREQMQQTLSLHGMAPRTQAAYLTAVQDIAKYYHQRPDTLSEAQLHAYLRFLLDERHLSASSVRVAIMGIRFFYTQTLRRPWPNIPLPKRTKTLPEVLSREEVARLLASTTTVRQHALLMTTYGGGLRVSEVVRLRVSDIDAGRGMLRVEQGKGRKDRYILLGPRLVAELRRYWQWYRPGAPWLFPKQSQPAPMPIVTAQRMYSDGQGARGDYQSGGHARLTSRGYDAFIGRGHGPRDPATLVGSRECHDDYALCARGPESSARARITIGELAGR